jgi:hypothetical protein
MWSEFGSTQQSEQLFSYCLAVAVVMWLMVAAATAAANFRKHVTILFAVPFL